MFELCEKGWTWGCSSQIDSTGDVLFTADAHRDNGKRFIVSADEKRQCFLNWKDRVPMTMTEISPHRNGWKVFEATRCRVCFRYERSGNLLRGKPRKLSLQ